MSRKKYAIDEINLIVERSLAMFGMTKLCQLAELFEKSPQDINNRIKRGTVVNLIEKEAYKRSVDFKWILTGIHSIQEPHLKFISDSPGAIKQRRVINEVVEILESGKVDIIDALVKNVREFKRAVDMSKRLFVCEDELIILKKEIADMRGELDRLTARPDGSDPQDAGSEKEII